MDIITILSIMKYQYIYTDKNEIIKSVYFDPAGFSSVQKTYNGAKEI